jgi:hypothetical protein
MRVLAKSRKIGHPHNSLRALWNIYEGGFTKNGADEVSLVYYAPTIQVAAPRLLEQPSLFGENLNSEDTVFDLLNDAIIDVRNEDKESVRFDKDLLDDFKTMLRAERQGISVIRISSKRYEMPAVADHVLGQNAKKLLAATPPPLRTRVTGELDMVRVSDAVFEVLLGTTRERFRALWTGADPQDLGSYLKKEVMVEGDLVFRPNGKPLRIEATYIRESRKGDELFTELPRPVSGSVLSSPAKAMTFKKLLGSWPGDESDEEVLEALEALS